MRLNHIQIVERLPAYFIFDRATLGNFALTTKETKYLIDEYATEYKGTIDSPGTHFSTVCKEIRFPKTTTYHDSIAYPYKAIPFKHPYCFYLDIRKAFYQIAYVVGMECSHREGRYMAFGATTPDSIFADSKIMRALLVGGTQEKSRLTEWKNHELTTRQFPNRNYAPMLQRAIFGVLHALAGLLDRYTVYHHTDGFIIPYVYFERVCRILDERGIQYSIKAEGITQIYGVGSYRIGQTHTRNYQRGQRPRSNIRDNGTEWWLKQWDRGKAYRG